MGEVGYALHDDGNTKVPRVEALCAHCLRNLRHIFLGQDSQLAHVSDFRSLRIKVLHPHAGGPVLSFVPRARNAGKAQFQTFHRPGLDAAARSHVAKPDNLAAEFRFPQYRHTALPFIFF